MSDKVFIDTNLWVYLYSDENKGHKIRQLIDNHFNNVIMSTQVLGELFSVLVKKGFKSKKESKEIISDLMNSFIIISIDGAAVNKAISLCIKYRYRYWDSLIIASACQNDCSILYSEDLQHGQIIENNLKIINSFNAQITS
ncbi:MAG: PIN domain-containing protein [Nitrospirae bacterium]|nr:PIN domain-containing protein [Nitrospirota bacterium]MCL5977964.1 PIN domain-containing protein [Nitrospirota bacterium]